MDNPAYAKANGFDCFSQTNALVVDLLMAGISANLSFAFATETANMAGTQDAASINPQDGTRLNAGTPSQLNFLPTNGLQGPSQNYEAYLFLCINNVADQGQTIAPTGGPYNGSNEPCGSTPQKLPFKIITQILIGTQAKATDPNGGRQWWFGLNGGGPVYGPVAFPPGFGPQ